MAQRFNDGTSGDVVIRSGPPASGGGGGWGGGGGSGGNRVGASGVTSGPSKSTKEARRLAKEEYHQTRQRRKHRQWRPLLKPEQARIYARNQLLAQFTQLQNITRAEIDQRFTARAEQLTSSLDNEISSAKRHHAGDSSERWQLLSHHEDKNEIDGLIALKTAELNEKNALARIHSTGTIRSREPPTTTWPDSGSSVMR